MLSPLLWLRVTLFSAAYFACALVADSLAIHPGPFVSFWLPSGLFVATLLRNERRHWPMFVLAAFPANIGFDLWHGQAVHVSFLFCCGNCLEALAGAWLVRRFVAERPDLSAVREVAGLTGLSALLSTTLSATVGATVVRSLGGGGSFGSTWLLWWSSDVLGVLLLAPVIVAWRTSVRWPPSWRPSAKQAETAAFMAVLCLSAIYVFRDEWHRNITLKYAMIPLVMWAAFRFGVRGAAVTSLVVAVIAAWFTTRGYSDMATVGLSPRDQVTALQLFLAVVTMTGLFLAAALSERQRAEEGLRESETRYRELIHHQGEGLGIVDPEERFTFVNPAGEAIFGVPPGGLVGRTLKEFTTPDQHAWVLEQTKKRRAGEKSTYEMEIVRPDGETRCMLVTAVPRSDAAGRFLGAFGLFRDITERKRAEEARRQLEMQLLHAQKLESLGVLAGGIAHDFNNILAGIMGYADLAMGRLPSSEPALADLGEIKKASRRAADLTRQMLAYSGKGKLVVEPLSLSRIVDDIRKMLEVSISKKAAVKYNLAPDLPAIEADVAQIHQVVMNLVINASEALGEQGGAISISTGTIQCNSADLAAIGGGSNLPEGLYVRLEVADTGCGMDQETMKKILDPFFTTKFTGRGLGLAAVHGIVQGHQGAIRVSSEPGQGTTVEVLFPASDAAVPVSRAEPVAAEPWRGSGTVLVVDDEEMVRNLAQRMIEQAGFSVLTAKDGEEAIRLYGQYRNEVACVLLDLTMPKISGEETFRELRRICPEVRVILSSGYSEEGATERFSGLGLAGFIQKPYELDTMHAKLREAVEGGAGDIPVSCEVGNEPVICVPPPAVATAQPSAKDKSGTARRKCGTGTVLVVDDDEMVRTSVQVMFELAGFSVLAAQDGEEAIRLYREHRDRIVCVYLDLTMPGIGGEKTFQELRRIDADVRVILASGYPESQVAERFAGQGAWAFLHKLDPLDTVIAKLREHLGAERR